MFVQTTVRKDTAEKAQGINIRVLTLAALATSATVTDITVVPSIIPVLITAAALPPTTSDWSGHSLRKSMLCF